MTIKTIELDNAHPYEQPHSHHSSLHNNNNHAQLHHGNI
jgi:hypothetical protein